MGSGNVQFRQVSQETQNAGVGDDGGPVLPLTSQSGPHVRAGCSRETLALSQRSHCLSSWTESVGGLVGWTPGLQIVAPLGRFIPR